MRSYALNLGLYNTNTHTHTIKRTRAHAYISVTYTVKEMIVGERELEFTIKWVGQASEWRRKKKKEKVTKRQGCHTREKEEEKE